MNSGRATTDRSDVFLSSKAFRGLCDYCHAGSCGSVNELQKASNAMTPEDKSEFADLKMDSARRRVLHLSQDWITATTRWTGGMVADQIF